MALIAPAGQHCLEYDARARLAEIGVEILDGPCDGLELGGNSIHLVAAGQPRSFDALYPALGTDIGSELASALGARVTRDGCPEVDKYQRTSVPRLYTAGDVVLGLDQISNAMGHGAVVATALRNDLAARHPLLRARR